jgi:predicted nucleotidyltransferase
VAQDSFFPDLIQRLRRDIPNVAAILLKGSHARGEAGPFSDVDIDVLVDREPFEDYLAWFEDADDGRLRHISAAVQDIGGWMAETREPVEWAYGLPAAETTRLLWARDDFLRRQLDLPARKHPPEPPELEDFVEAWGKIRNAMHADDDRGLRLAAQSLARYCVQNLRLLNPPVRPSHRREAIRMILAFNVAPECYREDLAMCLGLSGDATTMTDIFLAARRLTFGTIALMRGHPEVFRGEVPDDLFEALMNGTIDRYIRQ